MKANMTSIFIVNPIHGRKMNAIAMDNGTDNATKSAFTRPMKNISTIVTKMNPRIIVLLSSFTVFLVFRDWSPVTSTTRFDGSFVFCMSAMIAFILSDASSRFCPLFFDHVECNHIFTVIPCKIFRLMKTITYRCYIS